MIPPQGGDVGWFLISNLKGAPVPSNSCYMIGTCPCSLL